MPRKLLATLAIPILLAAGCGDGGSGEEVLTGEAALAALQSAPDAVTEAGSGRMTMTMNMTLEGKPISVDVAGEFAGDVFRMEMDMAEMFSQMGEEMPAEFGDDASIEMIMEGTSFYMRMPFLDQLLGEEGTWIGVSLDDLGIAADSLGIGPGANNPANVVELLRGSEGEVEELGSEEIRGEDTTGYRLEVDIAKAYEEMPDDVREVVESQLGEVSGTIPVEVWIDGDGLPRRVSMDMSDMLGELTEGGSVAAVMEFFDYGADIDIEIPDESDVRSFQEVFGGMPGMEFEKTGEAIG